MTVRRCLGVLATAVSGLLAAALLLSAPAFAWSANVEGLKAECAPDSGSNVVSGHVILSKEKVGGHVVIEAKLGRSGEFVEVADEQFEAGTTDVPFSFEVPSPDSDHAVVTVKATAFFDDNNENPVGKAYTKLEKCKSEETTTTKASTTTVVVPTTAPPTTTPPTTAVLGRQAASTVAATASSLPFTGANSLPLLIGALALVVGGGGLLFASRIRGRHAK